MTRISALPSILALLACSAATSTPITDVVGTWGGDNAGMIVTHPATFSGHIIGQTMTLTVTLTDTGQVLGPVTLVYGKEPKMGPCPICRVRS